jgi:hypothetical protein
MNAYESVKLFTIGVRHLKSERIRGVLVVCRNVGVKEGVRLGDGYARSSIDFGRLSRSIARVNLILNDIVF